MCRIMRKYENTKTHAICNKQLWLVLFKILHAPFLPTICNFYFCFPYILKATMALKYARKLKNINLKQCVGNLRCIKNCYLSDYRPNYVSASATCDCHIARNWLHYANTVNISLKISHALMQRTCYFYVHCIKTKVAGLGYVTAKYNHGKMNKYINPHLEFTLEDEVQQNSRVGK